MIMIKSQYLNCAPFNDCISKISNPKIDHAKDINIAIPVYNLIEYSDSYLNYLEVYGHTIEMNHL